MVAKIILALSLFGATSVWKDFRPLTVSKYGCHIGDVSPTKDTVGGFYTHVWAKHGNEEDFHLAYSIRPTLKEAMKDCDEWIEGAKREVEKAQKEAAKK